MKTFLVIIALFTTQFKAFSQTTIRVVLKSDIKIDSVGMIDISQKEFQSLPYADTLNFNFKKQNIDCYNLRFFVNGKLYWKQVWLDSGNPTVKAHVDGLHLIIDTVINSPVYYSVIGYLKKSASFANDTVARNGFMLGEIQKNIENPRSLAIANDYVNFNQNSKPNLLKLKILLAKQKTDFSWFLFYTIGIERMNKILQVKAIHLSDFGFLDRKSKTSGINLKNYDYYILDFWFIGCVPCMEQHKEIKLSQRKLKNNNVEVIGICIDNNPAPWNKYLLQHGYAWANYIQSGSHKLSDYLGINAFPAYVVLNNKGDIISTFGSLSDVFSSLKVK